MKLKVSQSNLSAAAKGETQTVVVQQTETDSNFGTTVEGGAGLAGAMRQAGIGKGSSIKVALGPDVTRMPGPPAPFVPAPLPNISKLEGALKMAGYSNVKVHTMGNEAGALKGIGARAFTQGEGIVFGSGVKTEGKNLVGHELTHALQQNQKR